MENPFQYLANTFRIMTNNIPRVARKFHNANRATKSRDVRANQQNPNQKSTGPLHTIEFFSHIRIYLHMAVTCSLARRSIPLEILFIFLVGLVRPRDSDYRSYLTTAVAATHRSFCR